MSGIRQWEGLGQVVVRAIPGLFAPSVSDATAQAWLTPWQDLSAGQPALTVPVRLLAAAVEWRPQRDPRALLRLPETERRVLEQVLARIPN